jgi:hypothetical protein
MERSRTAVVKTPHFGSQKNPVIRHGRHALVMRCLSTLFINDIYRHRCGFLKMKERQIRTSIKDGLVRCYQSTMSIRFSSVHLRVGTPFDTVDVNHFTGEVEMKQISAYTVSIGFLAFVDTYLTGTILPVPVWVTFIAWASFFIVGGGKAGFVKSLASNLAGLAISSATLLMISYFNGTPMAAAVLVGIGSALMVLASQLKLLNILPAIVWGFASTVGTTVATGKAMTTMGYDNPAVVAAVALLTGAVFGYVSELLGEALQAKSGRLA